GVETFRWARESTPENRASPSALNQTGHARPLFCPPRRLSETKVLSGFAAVQDNRPVGSRHPTLQPFAAPILRSAHVRQNRFVLTPIFSATTLRRIIWRRLRLAPKRPIA